MTFHQHSNYSILYFPRIVTDGYWYSRKKGVWSPKDRGNGGILT